MKTLSILLSIFVFSCTSVEKPSYSVSKPRFSNVNSMSGGKVVQKDVKNIHRVDKKYQAFKGEIEYRELKVESDWIGGSEVNPVFYTRRGERIYSLGKDIYVYPVTVLSIDRNGRVVYPEEGIQLTGDMQTDHFLSLVAKLGRKINTAGLGFHADSNFPEKPAKIIDLKTNKIIAEYVRKNDKWCKVR